MANLLIIGAGGVGRVATFKAAMNNHIFKNIVLASRTKSCGSGRIFARN